MRRAARAIIINSDRLLVIHRNKFGSEYNTLPGGNIDLGETPERALERELADETMVQFDNPQLVFIEHAGDPYGDQYIYLCHYVSGEPHLHPDSDEAKISAKGQNTYVPMWLPIDELMNSSFKSENLKQYIIAAVEGGWPVAAVEITTH